MKDYFLDSKDLVGDVGEGATLKMHIEEEISKWIERLYGSSEYHLKTLKIKERDLQQESCKLKILNVLQRLDNGNSTTTTRDIYYQCPSLFKNQQRVHRLLQQIVLDIDESDYGLPVTSVPKGIIFGNIRFFMGGNEKESEIREVDCIKFCNNGYKINPSSRYLFYKQIAIEMVLIVEKDAVFQVIMKHQQFIQQHHMLLITTCGQVDHYTMQFLKEFFNAQPTIPCMALYDCDVGGIQIMYTLARHLPTIQIYWLGILPSDIEHNPNVLMTKMKPKDSLRIQLWTKKLLKQSSEDVQPFLAQLKILENLKMNVGILGYVSDYSIASLVLEYLPNKIEIALSQHRQYLSSNIVMGDLSYTLPIIPHL